MVASATGVVILSAILCACLYFLRSFRVQNTSSRVLRSHLKKFFSIWFGATIAIIWSGSYFSSTLTPNPRYIEADGTLAEATYHLQRLSAETRPVIFITTTTSSAIQIPQLVRIAQSLFPVRDKVKWIAVALDDPVFQGDLEEKQHLENLQTVLTRTGVEFVLLSSYGNDVSLKSTWNGIKWPKIRDPNLAGYLTGLLWALKKFPEGMLIFGDDSSAYDSTLFDELYQTRKIANTWPVALNFDQAGMNFAPISRLSLDRYKNDTVLGLDSPFIERSAFAIDLNYLRTNIPYEEQWKFACHKRFTDINLDISLGDISVLNQGESRIFVWLTETVPVEWPSLIKLVKTFPHENTNIKPLLEASFAPRYKRMEEFISTTDSSKEYPEYDLEKDLGAYMAA